MASKSRWSTVVTTKSASMVFLRPLNQARMARSARRRLLVPAVRLVRASSSSQPIPAGRGTESAWPPSAPRSRSRIS